MRKAWAMLVMVAIALVSTLPSVAASEPAGDAPCPLCHMNMNMSDMAAMGAHVSHARAQAKRQVMPPAMRHCRIECCGRHDSVDGLPHLLAPHVAAFHSLILALVRLPAPSAMPAHPRRIWLTLLSPPPERV